jgi:hypothetical protein
MAVIQKNELLRIETFDRVAGLIPHIYRNRYQSRFRSEPSVLRKQRRSHKEYHHESHRPLCGQSRCHNREGAPKPPLRDLSCQSVATAFAGYVPLPVQQ